MPSPLDTLIGQMRADPLGGYGQLLGNRTHGAENIAPNIAPTVAAPGNPLARMTPAQQAMMSHGVQPNQRYGGLPAPVLTPQQRWEQQRVAIRSAQDNARQGTVGLEVPYSNLRQRIDQEVSAENRANALEAAANLYDPTHGAAFLGKGIAAGIGALRGMKRYPDLYHGTPDASSVDDILSQGFTKGHSAELSLPGTSLSRDPTIAASFARGDVGNVMRVTPDIPPSDVRNLRPSEYLTGVTGDKIYNKPNALLFDEAETFMPRYSEIAPDLTDTQIKLTNVYHEQDALLKQNPNLSLNSKEWTTLNDRAFELEVELSRLKKINVAPSATARRLSQTELDRVGKENDSAQRAITQVNEAVFDVVNDRRAADSLAPGIANAIRSVRGNRGAFDKVMRSIVNQPKLADGLGVDIAKAAEAKGIHSWLHSAVRNSRDNPPTQKLKGSGGSDFSDRGIDSSAANTVNSARLVLGKPEIPDPTIGDLRTTLDDVSRLWTTERDKVAKTIESKARLGVVDDGQAPLRNLENRTREARAAHAARMRNQTITDLSPGAT